MSSRLLLRVVKNSKDLKLARRSLMLQNAEFRTCHGGAGGKRWMFTVVMATDTTSSLYQDMIDRKIIHPAQFKAEGDSTIKSVTKLKDGKLLEIEWNSGGKHRYHSIWLRHNCHCPDCKLVVSGQQTVAIETIPSSITVQDIDISDDKVMKMVWKEGDVTHKGYIPTDYLKCYRYSGNALAEKSEAENIKFSTDTAIPEIDFKDVMETDTGLYKWLKLLGERGLCLVKNVPTISNQIREVIERVCYIQHTIYGEIFEVKSVENASNAAYLSIGLRLHMDQMTYESAPGIQLLHCLKFGEEVEGGESVFADIHHIVDVFRREHPKEFEVLCRVPVTYEIMGYYKSSGREKPVHQQIHKPMIVTNQYGHVISVAYHENLTGALQAHEDDVEPFYDAYRLLVQSVHDWPYKFYHRMRPGDMVTFQNRRALHGRNSFINRGGGERLFQGGYMNIDEFKSMLIYLHNTIGDGSRLCRMGLNDMC
ncbi:hypothetical protein LOTGIDRAFT_237554 [Lottia gigantea]|uniref:Gamma-butyrobetaine dioxygenase n=1 Tax=Lottia gigantea TaxID=225164 RepID=V4CMW3_LOTGI|nr:hypothetical protein LOTGIDRAFT_237554 [Lottia gigantea]ESP03720.1 hypothetical protein LOTGIDRAFT_237554 [Lottia gigantea]